MLTEEIAKSHGALPSHRHRMALREVEMRHLSDYDPHHRSAAIILNSFRSVSAQVGNVAAPGLVLAAKERFLVAWVRAIPLGQSVDWATTRRRARRGATDYDFGANWRNDNCPQASVLGVAMRRYIVDFPPRLRQLNRSRYSRAWTLAHLPSSDRQWWPDGWHRTVGRRLQHVSRDAYRPSGKRGLVGTVALRPSGDGASKETMEVK